jgi:hypothetical protein
LKCFSEGQRGGYYEETFLGLRDMIECLDTLKVVMSCSNAGLVLLVSKVLKMLMSLSLFEYFVSLILLLTCLESPTVGLFFFFFLSLWLLGFELRTSGRAIGALNH